MKTKFLLNLICVLNVASVFSQNNCLNGISSDFNNPVNGQMPYFLGDNGHSYYLNNFDWINLDPDFGVYSQYQLNEIIVSSDSNLDPDILLTLDEVLDYSQPMPISTLDRVISFCEGADGNAPVYQANISSRAFQSDNLGDDSSPLTTFRPEKEPRQVVLYPNPVSSNSIAHLSSDEDIFTESVGILITDATGRKKDVPVILSSANSLELDTSNLSSGMYLIRLVLGDEIVVKSLIVK